MQWEVLQITHHCKKQKDCSPFRLLDERKRTFFSESHPRQPFYHLSWSVSIVISGRSLEYMTSRSSPSLCCSSHSNPLEKTCIIHHILETNETVCLQMHQEEKRNGKKNNWNLCTTLIEKKNWKRLSSTHKKISLQSLKRLLRYFHNVWHRRQLEHYGRETEEKQTRAKMKHHFSCTKHTGWICWGK